MAEVAVKITDQEGRPLRGRDVRFTADGAPAIADEATDSYGMIRTVFPDTLLGREVEVWLDQKRLGSFKVGDGIQVMI
jgi:hypothetical protein